MKERSKAASRKRQLCVQAVFRPIHVCGEDRNEKDVKFLDRLKLSEQSEPRDDRLLGIKPDLITCL